MAKKNSFTFNFRLNATFQLRDRRIAENLAAYILYIVFEDFKTKNEKLLDIISHRNFEETVYRIVCGFSETQLQMLLDVFDALLAKGDARIAGAFLEWWSDHTQVERLCEFLSEKTQGNLRTWFLKNFRTALEADYDKKVKAEQEKEDQEAKSDTELMIRRLRNRGYVVTKDGNEV